MKLIFEVEVEVEIEIEVEVEIEVEIEIEIEVEVEVEIEVEIFCTRRIIVRIRRIERIYTDFLLGRVPLMSWGL